MQIKIGVKPIEGQPLATVLLLEKTLLLDIVKSKCGA